VQVLEIEVFHYHYKSGQDPLSAKFLQHLSCPPGSRKTVYRDAACRGLLLEVRSTGGRTWYLTYTNKRGKRH